MSSPPRFAVVSYPAHGHIHPALRLADRLALLGCHVTFVTTVFARSRIMAAKTPAGNNPAISLFSDGHDDGYNHGGDGDFEKYNSELRRRGSDALRHVLASGLEEGRPYAGVVYTLLLHWATGVAAEFDIPATVLWVQPAAVFGVCYHYFHGDMMIRESYSDKARVLKLPWLGVGDISGDDLPTFLDHTNPNPKTCFVKFFQEQFDVIDKQTRPNILVNTFDALEPDALRATVGSTGSGPRLFGVGPLVRSDRTDAVIEWLDRKPKGSVVYVSFGSVAVMSMAQIEEIARGLLAFGRPFLWVIRKLNQDDDESLPRHAKLNQNYHKSLPCDDKSKENDDESLCGDKLNDDESLHSDEKLKKNEEASIRLDEKSKENDDEILCREEKLKENNDEKLKENDNERVCSEDKRKERDDESLHSDKKLEENDTQSMHRDGKNMHCDEKQNENDNESVLCDKKLKELGMIVPWCGQTEVLAHPSTGCFVSHCGWNSSMESMANGVRVVAFPQSNDQVTNAKLIEDVWKIGLRVKKSDNGLVGGEELKRCLEMVVLEGKELGNNAQKWKALAREAVNEGGSSDNNLKAFVAQPQHFKYSLV